MVRRTTVRERAIAKMADAETMASASLRSSHGSERDQRTKAYFYGNLGDSVERRFGGDGYGLLGGGYDGYDGVNGPAQSWNAQGYGNYLGTGLINGFGRMNGGAQGGLGGMYSGGFTYLKRFSSQSAFNHGLIASCMMAYLGYGVVRNIVDLYADFAAEGLEINHPDESVQNFYRAWATKVNLNERVHSLLLNLFVSANCFVHRRWASLEPNEKRQMKRVKSSVLLGNDLLLQGEKKDTIIEGTETGFIDWYLSKGEVYLNRRLDDKNGKATGAAPPAAVDEESAKNPNKRIPWGYTFLNPLQMELRGRRIRGQHYWVMGIDKRDTLEVARGYGFSTRQELGTTEYNLPKEFLDRVKQYQGPGFGYSAEIELNNEELSVLQAPGKWDWFDWAVPFVWPSLRALSFKDCLRSMEIKACQSVINSIFLFKLGKISEGMPAEDEHFERLADMLQQPGQAMNILWNEAIDAEVLQPRIESIFDTQKHDSADKDILTALGVPEVLIGGKGGNFSNSFIGVATVLEKLKSYRAKVHEWLMGEIRIIAKAMNFQKLPTVRFGRTSLTDRKAEQAFVTAMYDRNILSADSALRLAGTTVEIEAKKMTDEKKLRGKNVLEPRGPFIKEPKPPAAGAPGAKKKAPPKTGNGRPANTGTGPTGKQSNPRGPKGQGLADVLTMQEDLLVRGRQMLDEIEAFCGQRLMAAKAREDSKMKHLKQLKAEERERLEQMIYNVFSHMPPPDSVNPIGDDFIIHMLESDACLGVKADVFDLYTEKVSEYSKIFGKTPTREARRQFMVSAWTQRAIVGQLGEKATLL